MFTQALDIFLALEPCPMVRGQRWRLWLLSLLLLCNSFLSKKKKKKKKKTAVKNHRSMLVIIMEITFGTQWSGWSASGEGIPFRWRRSGVRACKDAPRFCGESRELAPALSGLMESTQDAGGVQQVQWSEVEPQKKKKKHFVIVLVGG
jgi:hypothetical protein